ITKGADYNGVHGYLSGEVGNYDDWKTSGAVNIPIIDDVLSVRLAATHWNRSGWGTSLLTGQDFNNHDDTAARVSIRFDPTPDISAITKIEHFRSDTNGAYTHAAVVNVTNS